jgi:hypothetical protein
VGSGNEFRAKVSFLGFLGFLRRGIGRREDEIDRRGPKKDAK